MTNRKSQNKIVVDYHGDEKLIMLAIRNTETGTEIDNSLQWARQIGFDVVDEVNLNLDDIKKETSRPDFINEEGFVVRFKSGTMIKFKYKEYFRLHKIICNVNEKFVWEFLSKGKKIELDNIPDETFDFIKATEKSLHDAFNAKWKEADKVYREICLLLNQKYGHDNWEKKDFALIAVPTHKKLSGVLFKFYENRFDKAKEIIWKMIEPKFEKGVSGFQSMKIGA